MSPERKNTSGGDDLVRLYLDGIGQYPLLDKEEEVMLAQQIEVGKAATSQLTAAGAEDQMLSASEQEELRRQQAKGKEATEAFVNANLRLVVSNAKKYQGSELPLLDLIQEGNRGLIHAVEKFDWRKGFKFSTYATWWIRQAISRGISDTEHTVRIPVHAGDELKRYKRVRAELEGDLQRSPTKEELAESLDITTEQIEVLIIYERTANTISLDEPIGESTDMILQDVIADVGALAVETQVIDDMRLGYLEKLLEQIDKRSREILRLRYGLDRGEPRTLEEVGDLLGITRERVRQLESAALKKLKSNLELTHNDELKLFL